ncbi:hypothetical protein Q8A67_005410 [Cirrhinus molitorella]|uniref:Uncharacterized protein n=1 Tax=Cirrhinus molitorella TaxID=172907 RepID=A0AA88TXD8_9TELE|nr:hypothetical protein Q8A67_005410 [Cirrhinus molitorella]
MFLTNFIFPLSPEEKRRRTEWIVFYSSQVALQSFPEQDRFIPGSRGRCERLIPHGRVSRLHRSAVAGRPESLELLTKQHHDSSGDAIERSVDRDSEQTLDAQEKSGCRLDWLSCDYTAAAETCK